MFDGINKEKIDLNSFKLYKKKTDILTIYDRYELRFRLITGEIKTITLYTDKGTIPKNIPIEYHSKRGFHHIFKDN